MEFITIDFETATAQRDSPCEIGLTFVSGGQIVDTKSWLIKPMYDEFDYFNILIHGIRPEHVADKPEFNELWKEIKPLVENKFLIAHNAGFDISVLRRTLEAYQLPLPTLNYSCSYIFSKKHKKTFTRNVNRENTNIHPLCCSIYLFYAEDPRWASYLSHWKTLKEKYQYFFFICTNVQLPQMRPVMEEFGNIIYESPHYCVNNNTMTSDRLKLFIAEKV